MQNQRQRRRRRRHHPIESPTEIPHRLHRRPPRLLQTVSIVFLIVHRLRLNHENSIQLSLLLRSSPGHVGHPFSKKNSIFTNVRHSTLKLVKKPMISGRKFSVESSSSSIARFPPSFSSIYFPHKSPVSPSRC